MALAQVQQNMNGIYLQIHIHLFQQPVIGPIDLFDRQMSENQCRRQRYKDKYPSIGLCNNVVSWWWRRNNITVWQSNAAIHNLPGFGTHSFTLSKNVNFYKIFLELVILG